MNAKELKKIDPSIIEDVKIKVFQKILEVHKKLEDMHKFKIPSIPILFTKKGAVAGVFILKRDGTMLINFNMAMILKHTEHFVDNVVPHEYCHYVVCLIASQNPKLLKKIKAHGEEWRQMMKKIGVEPTRCHNYDVPKKNYYLYQCDCVDGVLVGPQIHKKISLGNHKTTYRCKKCKEPIGKNLFSRLIKI